MAGGLLAFSAATVAFLRLVGPSVEDGSGPGSARPCGSRAGLIEPARAEPPAAEVVLGERLFGDPRLSVDGSVSCATCHQRSRAFTDGRPAAVGVGAQVGPRNTPAIANVAYAPIYMWDGRAATLEDVVRGALTNPAEMGMTAADVPRRLGTDGAEFEAAIRARPDIGSVSRALAAYLLSLRAGGSAVDRFLYCDDAAALTAQQRTGLELFAGRAHCVRCHVFEHEATSPLGRGLALFTDNRFHNVGAGPGRDRGRAGVTGRSGDEGAFKTPSLRNVALTAPYMHDGNLPTLRAVVDFYNLGGGHRAGVDPDIVPLNLDATDIDALVAFLEALTSPVEQDPHPPPAPAGASVGGGR